MYTIYRSSDSETMKYAARELAKYLTLITGEDYFEIKEYVPYKEGQVGIWLGYDKDFEVSFDVEDPHLDDAVAIAINSGSGYIAGSNERSILIGVYRFLTELGCCWIRPCKDGEILVKCTQNEMNVRIEELASLRHRGVVIEGANSYENVLDMIEWLPKLGYNSYFIQFMHAYSFFKQWYAHRENPYKQQEFFDDEMAELFTEQLGREIKKRGLIYHVVGHGWTCESLGIPGRGWDAEIHPLTEDQRSCLALVNGERGFWGNVPLNTNLCNASPRVQILFTESVVDYARIHKNADMIHVWVADAFNNHCECEKCRELTPTDWYVQILNRIDERLTEEGIESKIVFLLYFELLWTPIQERLHHPDRFIMMFAPISRTFTRSYQDCVCDESPIIRYPLNQIKLPSDVTEYMRFLKGWQEIFEGDSFDFDYHLGRSHYGDPGYYEIARTISKDIKALKDLGLNGLLSCQQQRTFFPTALPSYVMGRTLWDTTLEFEEIANDYFSHAFGVHWKVCQSYLKAVSDVFDMDYWHLGHGKEDTEFAERMSRVNTIIDDYRPQIISEGPHVQEAEELSWKYLRYHLEYTRLFAEALGAKARGEGENANKKWTLFSDYICKNEDELQRALDIFRVQMIGRIFNGLVRVEVMK
ncbi:MAG: DUF4838 domain-containing protein [Cellulosilyticaceae bacterium]